MRTREAQGFLHKVGSREPGLVVGIKHRGVKGHGIWEVFWRKATLAAVGGSVGVLSLGSRDTIQT